jgi:serine/threonine protein phosphatase PrpC
MVTMGEPDIRSKMSVVPTGDLETLQSPNTQSPFTVRSFGLTDRGKERSSNQDQFLIATLVKALQVQSTSLPQPRLQQSSDRGHLFIVADGMGGHAGGEQASALAIDSVETFILDRFKWFAHLKGQEQDQVFTDFQRALGRANARILAEAAESPALRGMGTTLTLAYSVNEDLFVAHVGDSRCYLYRKGMVHRITSDHTLVEEMIRRGTLSAEEADEHCLRHVIINAVGGNMPEVKVELHKLRLIAGDGILLCSDGLTNTVSDEDIADILQAETDPESICRKMVARANDAGGPDNITVVYVQYDIAGH